MHTSEIKETKWMPKAIHTSSFDMVFLKEIYWAWEILAVVLQLEAKTIAGSSIRV